MSAVLGLGPEVNGTNRMVLLVLAEAANAETDECWPGRKLIAERAGVKQLKYVDKAVAALVEMGLVAVDPNGCPDHRIRADQRPNLYNLRAVLDADGGAHRAAPRRARTKGRDAPARGGASRPDEGARRAPQTVREPDQEPDQEPGVGSAAAAPSEVRQDVEDCCAHLAARIEGYSAGGARPPVTERWRKDMRLLIDRGWLRDEHAQPVPPAKVRASIDAVFDRLADPGRDGFCWAAQIRSPGALRDHWCQLAEAFRRQATTPRSAREQRMVANGTAGRVLDALAVGRPPGSPSPATVAAARTPELAPGGPS